MSVRLQVTGRQASAPGTTGTCSVHSAPGQCQLRSLVLFQRNTGGLWLSNVAFIHTLFVQSSVPPMALGSASSPPASVSPFVSGTEKRLRRVELC